MDNFADIIFKSNKLLNKSTSNSLNIHIFTNTIIQPIDKLIKYNLEKKNIKNYITYNNYDSLSLSKTDDNKKHISLVIWEIENIFPNKFSDIEFKDKFYVEDVIKTQIKKFDLFFDNLKSKLILIKKFNNYNYYTESIYENKIDFICDQLNLYLHKVAKKDKRIILFDDCDIYKKLKDNYYSKNFGIIKMPYYSVDALLEISFKVSLIILNHFGQSKKVLIVDCDNTLWNGIIGEDDNNKIFSKSDIHREKFQFVSKILTYLKKKGIILAISSKNNFKDVENFFKRKSNYLINFKDFNIKKINWTSKSKNILEIAKELNLGTSSFVFLDDSEFEIAEVESSIKDIDCIKVPNDLSTYKKTLIDLCKYFNKLENDTKEDKLRNNFYAQENQRIKLKKKNSFKDYLKSLGLELYFGKAKFFELERIAQLTQKTNQFNLSLERQTLDDVKKIIKSKNREIFAFSLKDKFGEYGTVGLANILYSEKQKVVIENFLMSCRVMGRHVEQTFLAELLKIFRKNKIKIVEAQYIKGPKNQLVKNFYTENGFNILKKNNSKFIFKKKISNSFNHSEKQFKIKVKYAR